jgi:hypothetical protein
MADQLTFTLRGNDELSRVLNGTADSADRLRLRMAGITADSDGRLRDLRGRFVTVQEAQQRLTASTTSTTHAFHSQADAAEKLGEKLKASLISLAPAAIPASAAVAQAAAAVAAQFGAVAVAAAAYTVALKPQIAAIGEAVQAQDAYEDAVRTSGATSAEAVKAQDAYLQKLGQLPPATRKAAVAVGLLKQDFQAWSDQLSGDVMGPFLKGVAIADTLLPKTSGLVRGASTEFDRLITMVGGAIETPGFDRLVGEFTDFADTTLDHGIDQLREFFARVERGDLRNSGLEKFLAYARENGPAVWETLENLGDALLHVLQAGSDVGVGMLTVVNVLSNVVSAVPPEGIATLLQLAIALKAVRLAAAGLSAGRAALAAIGVQITAMTTAAGAAPSALGRTGAAIGALSTKAKLAAAGTALGLLLTGLTMLRGHSEKTKPDVDKLATSVGVLGDTGQVSGELLHLFGKNLTNLSADLDVLAGKHVDFGDASSVKGYKENLDALDKSLANLVNSGKSELAAKALGNITKNLDPAQTKALNSELNDYRDALAGAALEQRLTAESMGMFGEQAQETQAKLDAQKKSADGLRESIQALNDVNRKGLSGMIGFEAAIDAATEAAKKNHGVLKERDGQLVLTTDKQRAAASALNDLAAKTDEATAAARDQGKSWAEVSDIYSRGREQLIKTAQQMGLTKKQAKQLADQILDTPDKTAYLKGDLSDLEAKLAAAKTKLKNAPSSKTAKIKGDIKDLEKKIANAKSKLKALHDKTIIVGVQTKYKGPDGKYVATPGFTFAGGGLIGRAQGGAIPGFRPGGGLLQGPGTPTSDSILMWGSTGEFMMRAAAVDKYGVKFMEAVNAGRLPVGQAAPRAGLPAAPVAGTAGAPTAVPAVDVHVHFRDDRLRDLIDVQVTPKIAASEARSAYRATVGRR